MPNSNEGDLQESNPVINANRTCTDIHFLILIVAFVVVLVGLLAYCVVNGDIYRVTNGFDDCGNICGRKNTRYDFLGCSGADKTNEKYLLVSPSTSLTSPASVYRICVESCSERASYGEFLNRCLPIRNTDSGSKKSFFSKTGIQDFFQEVSEDLESCWLEIVYLCILSFVASILIMFAFRFFAGFLVWLVLIGIIIALLCGTIFLWILYANSGQETDNLEVPEERNRTYLILAIIVTVALVCISLIILALRDRIKLVIQLFKEAGKALISMPALLFEPLLTFGALAFFACLWFYFAIYVESSGHITVEGNESIKFVKDSTMKVTRWYNLLALFWFVNFVIGCQHMVIAGAVSMWFFTRNKAKLSLPVARSFQNLIRFHLGTVAKGSFFIALVNLIRAILKYCSDYLHEPTNSVTKALNKACQCCLYVFEKFLQYLTRNAYIETAMAGYSFCNAGKRAFNILSSNALRVFAINSIGDFVLLLGKGLVVLITVIVGIELIQRKEGIHHNWVPLAIAGLFAYLVAHCFISVFEMIIDTIFICFCEDCEQNDGINRPYFMSRGLMEFIQNSKKAMHIDEKRGDKAWSVEPETATVDV
ncbi:choline transporter-like protein 1 isoform X2 [Hermetia illucens]|uniref:choline transporter-like protein 1 isoform X2 n=1 Tax=Hermetia illucens TaxID=343691 RepID=UPI0018CC1705|nr:choline transporter-like protein 1 isoform X2 [Hermetia illucens]